MSAANICSGASHTLQLAPLAPCIKDLSTLASRPCSGQDATITTQQGC